MKLINCRGEKEKAMDTKITKTYEITFSNKDVFNRFERFLSLLHFNSGFGHSGLFGMSLDGDGSEKINVDRFDKRYMYEVDAIGGAGNGIEVALDNGYKIVPIDTNKECKYRVGPAANLYRDGEIIKTVPSCDWDHPKNR
ncbi:MAG: hypothetical protein Q8910_00610 [Bacteroidota bacterium]|nr:hypothetical protein [Bacteroidota bacterium]